ncbi:MAG: hypothetical protein HY303_10895 [Candidatus Wallbacteria bacterium]|nr:hypothetical protein [Candidatus Wallbacteria bacterium]
MFRKRALVLLLAALAGAGAVFAEETQAVLLFVGDTYGCLGYPGWPGGVARLAYAVREQRKRHPGSPLLHTGNAIAPFYYSRFDRGRLYSQSLDSIGDVIWNLGFHDVDYGWQHLSELRATMPNTTLLGSNLTADRDAPRDWVVKQVGGLRIGFIGLVDPIVERLKAVGLFGGLAVREPFEAAREAVKRHRADADLLVLVADLPEDDAERLARETVGPDVVISGSRHQQDWYTFFHGREPRQVLERRRADGSRVLMLSGPRDGFSLGKLTISARRDAGKWRIERVLPEVLDLTAQMPQDEPIWSRVAAHLNRLESQASTPLLTGLQQRFPDGIDGERFTRWTVGAMREAVRAEVGVLNAGTLFKPGYTAPECWKRDRITDLDLENIFWTDNHLVKVKLLGANLTQVVADDRAGGHLRFSGLTRKDGQILINGRKLVPQEHYLVATTNYLVAESPKSRGFDAALETHAIFEDEDGALEPAEGEQEEARGGAATAPKPPAALDSARGAPATPATTGKLPQGSRAAEKARRIVLRELMHERLLSWSARHPLPARPPTAEPFEPVAYPDQRSVLFNNLTLNISDFNARGNKRFPRVRNPAISSADVKTIQGGGEVIVRDDSLERRSDLGLRYAFQSLEFPGNRIANPIDDLYVYDRWLDRAVGFDGGFLGGLFHPYVELAYETEFRPTTGNPLNKVVWLQSGVAQLRDGPLKGWRFAGIVKNDRSAVIDTEYGLGFGYQGAKQLDRFRLETDTSFRTFFRRDDDTPDDLLYELYSKNEVVVPITSDVSVSFMGNLFAYHGKVVDSDGANLFLGVGFRFDKLWKPHHEPFSK